MQKVGCVVFGFVAADETSLSAKDTEIYRGAYCGLCAALGRRHGSGARLTLNYEMSFLALILSSVYGLGFEESSLRCGVHPICRQTVFSNEIIDYAADMNIVLSYHNALDGWIDDRNVVSLAAVHAMRGDYVRLRSKYPRQCINTERCMDRLHMIEASGDPSPDNGANAFGELLSEIFIWQEDALSERLRSFGASLGRAVYIMDAAVDIRSDLRHRRYNPFAFVTVGREEILDMLMAECCSAYEELPILDYKDIFENILYSGIWIKYRCKARKEGKSVGKRSV